MIGVMLVDDHALIRRGMRDALAMEPGISVVAEASGWQELLQVLPQVKPDVLLLDINLPGGLSGLDILERMRQAQLALKTLIVSMYPEDQYAVKALKAGALGYINKSADTALLVEGIRAVAQGRKFITPTVAGLLADRVAQPVEMLAHERLSEREQRLLRMIAEGTRLPEIAQQLDMAPKTVSVWRARLLEKMRLSTNAEVAHYAQRHGLV